MILRHSQLPGALQPFTITLNGLTAAASQQSGGVITSGSDVMIQVVCKLVAGTPADEKAIRLFVSGSIDGTLWGDNASGTNGALTMRNPTNLSFFHRACERGGESYSGND
jgi:hypothetical protein